MIDWKTVTLCSLCAHAQPRAGVLSVQQDWLWMRAACVKKHSLALVGAEGRWSLGVLVALFITKLAVSGAQGQLPHLGKPIPAHWSPATFLLA
jgi:hypothetical protein